MKVFIDVSNLMHVNFISGIQRVVREVVTRLAGDAQLEIILLEYRERENHFGILSVPAFLAYFRDETGDKEGIRTDEVIGLMEFPHGSVFLELDSVWHSKCNRMLLYPELKARGVKIAVCYQDLIPIMWPEYAADVTIQAFLGYMTACVTYGDLFISSTRTNIKYLHDFMNQIGVENPAPCSVSWLGTDFSRSAQAYHPGKGLEGIVGRGKYLLMVGTVEPRKNHALVLTAMEQSLFSEGWQLVIVGHQGWNIREVAERIRNHPQYGRQLHWLEEATDADVEYLYAHSSFVVFPSFTEGFGLPIVEACARGVPVLCSDHPVMREVGGDYCRYFSATDPQSLIRVLHEAQEEQTYGQLRASLQGYRAVSWDEVAVRIGKAIKGIYPQERTTEQTAEQVTVQTAEQVTEQAAEQVMVQMTDQATVQTIEQTSKKATELSARQMVILSARAEDFLRSLPFIERFMPFIQEIVLCCPDPMEAEVSNRYTGKLRIRYLTDSVLLEGSELPADHAARNIFLRAKAIKHAIIDEFFLMSDDDYRPLREISMQTYYQNGKFQAYYTGDLRHWKGTQGVPTSFDVSMWKCRDFLMEQKYSTYMFDAHMPQIICKSLFLEMLERYPCIMEGASSEWSGYFNYLVSEYPERIDIRPYVTMNWPGFPEDWNTEVKRPEYLFENFYDIVYEDREVYRSKGHFTGFSKEYSSGITKENRQKADICRAEERRHERELTLHHDWQHTYCRRYGMEPVFAVCDRDGILMLKTPGSMLILKEDFLRMDFQVMVTEGVRKDEEWQLTWTVWDETDKTVSVGSSRFRGTDRSFQVLLMAPEQAGQYRVEWNLYAGSGCVSRQMILQAEE